MINPVRVLLVGAMCCMFFINVEAQNFINGDLNGTIGVSATPTSWLQVPNTDPASLASGAPQSTSDVTGATGPIAANICGNPYSGSTFVSGLQMSITSSVWHEGIMQTVSGLTSGNQYQISLWQTVSKQSNATDNSGGWSVYRDNTLLGVTAATTSTLPVGSTSRVWEKRWITFTATSGTHTFKFLPTDDDANYVSPDGVRMGIDSLALFPFTPLPVELVSFNAIPREGGIELSWTTSSEINNDYFIVERSENAMDYIELARIEGAGNSNILIDYGAWDMDPVVGQSYYRLKQVDFDGSSQVFDVAAVYFSYDDFINIYPNPILAGGCLQITGIDLSGQTVDILGENGTLIKQIISDGTGFNLDGIAAGKYFIRFTLGKEVLTRKLIVQ